MSRMYLPGFGLKPSIYSRLDLGKDSSCIDLEAKASLDETITNFVSRTPQGSIGIGYSMGARLLLATALREHNHFKGLVLVSLNAGISDVSERTKRFKEDQEFCEELEKNADSAFSSLDSKNVFETNNIDAQFLKENRIKDPEVLVNQIKSLGLGEFDSIESDLINLRIPVLYITGSRDSKYTSLSARYKKQTPFSHHKVLDSDHRVPITAPKILSMHVDWFANKVV